jgi:carbonic anhydrase
MPGYREALIEAAVCINAAQSAFDLRQEVERNGKWEIEVLYGVHNIRNHQVCMPVDPTAQRADENVRLAQAPTNPKEFHALAVQMAAILGPGTQAKEPVGHERPARVPHDVKPPIEGLAAIGKEPKF